MLALLSPLGLHIFIFTVYYNDGINFTYMMSVVREGCVEMLPAGCGTWHGGLISKIKNVVKLEAESHLPTCHTNRHAVFRPHP